MYLSSDHLVVTGGPEPVPPSELLTVYDVLFSKER